MNFSASANPKKTVQSVYDWWSLAGVDLDYTDQPGALLADPIAKAAEQPVPQAVTESVMPAFDAAPAPTDYPAEHDAFLLWLSNPENLIEAGWANTFVQPKGEIKPAIMVISAMPDSADEALYSEKNDKLLAAMLSAIGCDSQQSYLAPLALTRPADGRLDETAHQSLKHRMLHLIDLVQPEKIIVIGDTTSKILFEEDLLTARKRKRYINHVSSKTEAIATFHPRILIERPEFKAAAWKDLQLLMRIQTP